MAFYFLCPTEVIAFNNVIDEFTEQGCAVAFVSTDSKHRLYQWVTRPKIEGGLGNVKIPLLSDRNHKMCKAYGVLLEECKYSLRGLFMINRKGILKHVGTAFAFTSGIRNR
jgi:peroxiredoxin 2/4